MAEVLEIRDLETLEAHRLSWNALVARSPGPVSALHFDAFRDTWDPAQGAKELKVLVVKALGRTVGFLPLAIVLRRTWYGTARVICQAVASQWEGSVVGPDRTATYLTAMRFLAQRRSEWEELDLCLVDGSELARCRSAMQWASIEHVESRDASGALSWHLRGVSRGLPGRIVNRCMRLPCRIGK